MRDFIINFFFSFCAGAGITVVVYMLILTTCQFIDVIKEYKEKWRKKDEFGSKCPCCGLYAYRDEWGDSWESNFCPNCGAKMGNANAK